MLPTGTTRAGRFEGRAAGEPGREDRPEEADKMCGCNHWTPRPGDTNVLVCSPTPVRLACRPQDGDLYGSPSCEEYSWRRRRSGRVLTPRREAREVNP